LGFAGFPAVMARFYLPWVLGERGDFDEGIRHGCDGIRLAEALDHPYSLAVVCWGLAHLYIIRGDLGQAVRQIERGLALSREWNVAFMSVLHTASLGSLTGLSGQVAEGIRLREEAVTDTDTMGFGSVLPISSAHLGEANVLAGRLHTASDIAARTLTL